MLDGRASEDHSVVVDYGDMDLHGLAFLVRTGWDARLGTREYWESAPSLSPELVDALVEAKAALVGVDFGNVDNTAYLARPAHTRLLDAGVLIVENLSGLAALPRGGFWFYAVPLRIVGGASFPLRAFAETSLSMQSMIS